MMDMESLRVYMNNIYVNYHADEKHGVSVGYTAKCMGALEALLVVMNILKPGCALPYGTKERVFKFLWLFPIKYTSKETYIELILRLTEETLGLQPYERA